jgi:hypothetical protein
LLSGLPPYAKDIIGDHQCGFRRNRSTTNRIFSRVIPEKEIRIAVYQLFIDFREAYVSVRKDVI